MSYFGFWCLLVAFGLAFFESCQASFCPSSQSTQAKSASVGQYHLFPPRLSSIFPNSVDQDQSLQVEISTKNHEEEQISLLSSVPFIIERIPKESKNNPVFEEVAEMCIDVFFNAEPGPMTPWKGLQLGFLRNLQSTDLKQRKIRGDRPNIMFVARRILPMNDASVRGKAKLILLNEDRIRKQVFGLEPQDFVDQDFVRGEVLGFCEVTKRPYGLAVMIERQQEEERRQRERPSMDGGSFHVEDNRRRTNSGLKYAADNPARPVLTNLAVDPTVRQAGIGSALLRTCELSVVNDWGDDVKELILEVEDDNARAMAFYLKRGYEVAFADPTCRRFDTSGLILRKERCTKICLRKDLSCERPLRINLPNAGSFLGGASTKTSFAASRVSSSVQEISKFFNSIKEKVLN